MATPQMRHTWACHLTDPNCVHDTMQPSVTHEICECATCMSKRFTDNTRFLTHPTGCDTPQHVVCHQSLITQHVACHQSLVTQHVACHQSLLKQHVGVGYTQLNITCLYTLSASIRNSTLYPEWQHRQCLGLAF